MDIPETARITHSACPTVFINMLAIDQ